MTSTSSLDRDLRSAFPKTTRHSIQPGNLWSRAGAARARATPMLGGAPERETRYPLGMSGLKARVENGRLTLNEPTDLPEGQIIELIPLDEVISTEGDDLDDVERAALHRSIDESIDDEEKGNVEDLSKILAELRTQL